MIFLYFDFEYRDNENPDDLVLLSIMPSDTKKHMTIDLRDGKNREEVRRIYSAHIDSVWVAYNAQADLKCLLSLGCDINPLKVIDSMAEARMITLTHWNHHAFDQSLLSSLKALDVGLAVSESMKDDARNLILGKVEYTDKEWSQIEGYGPTDVTPLPYLMQAVSSAHDAVGSPVTLEEMIVRGEYVKAVTGLSYYSKGFPVDEAKLNSIYENRPAILHRLKKRAIQEYGPVYKWNKSRSDYSWNHAGFEALIDKYGFDWEYTESRSRLALSRDFLKEKTRQHQELILLYRIRNTCSALTSTDLRSLMKDGHIKPVAFTFGQKAGRNSHRPKYGFILNLPPYIRTVIRPKPGMVFIGADYKSQEICIAAILSGDRRLLDAYNSKDVYISLAVMMGAVPANATKESHPIERQTFKAVQLGLGYGKGVKSLSADIYDCNRDEHGVHLLTLDQAAAKAEEIYDWHQETFSVYWDWLRDSIDRARVNEYIRSTDGWTYFVDDTIGDTKLLNFPMQSNGAAILRRAIIRCWEAKKFDVVCTLHDAIYVSCLEDEKEVVIGELKACMDGACRDVLGDTVTMPVDIKIYDSRNGYQDYRANQLLDELEDIIGS